MIDKTQLYRDYIGASDQLFGVTEGRLTDGRSDGLRFVEIDNGNGLNVKILEDRSLDIYQVRFFGKSLNYIAAGEASSPCYYSPFGEGWSEAFYGGFLYTCGLTNTGIKCKEGWETEKEHGCISNIPARHVNINRADDDTSVTISGTVHEGMLGGANLTLNRKIQIWRSTNKISVTDTVKNNSCRDTPVMILYHCNTGYPLLSEKSVVNIPHIGNVVPRTEHAAKYLKDWAVIEAPKSVYEEQCFYFTPKPEKDGWARVHLKNPSSGIQLEIAFDTSTLDHFLQWKNFVKGEYIMGLEPCNATLDGRDDARKNGSLKTLKPNEELVFQLQFTVTEI